MLFTTQIHCLMLIEVSIEGTSFLCLFKVGKTVEEM